MMKNSFFDVVNFHLTEKCNYRCSYCFAKFDNENEMSIDGWKKAADIIQAYFKRNHIENGRINIAGGEPLIVNYLNPLIDYIHSLGIKISIITNGSLLSKKHIDLWAGKVQILGISIDSLNRETNLKIGRANGSNTLDTTNLIEILRYAKTNGFKLKVNTVISKLNTNEDIMDLYKAIDFDRIKLLQMRINKNCNEQSENLRIEKNEFLEYCQKIQQAMSNVTIEPDEDLDSSYVIIDPYGNLVANHKNVHAKTGSIFENKLEELIDQAKLSFDTFNKRYIKHGGVL